MRKKVKQIFLTGFTVTIPFGLTVYIRSDRNEKSADGIQNPQPEIIHYEVHRKAE